MSMLGIGFSGLGQCRFFRFALCGLALLLVSPVTAHAGTLPTPYWSVPTGISTDDGYADLSWAVSGGDPVSFFKLTERFMGNSSIHFVDHPTTRLYRLKPGQYEFRVQACTRDPAGYPSCGQESDRLDLTVGESVVEPPTIGGPAKGSPPGQVRSPSGLTPGRWHNVDRMGHGWSFYWKSRLALPDGDPLFGDAWDLVGLWYTYELRGGTYRPMYAELVFTDISAVQAVGTVLVTRGGQTTNVGSVALTFQSDSQAYIDWEASFLTEYIDGEDQIELLVAPDSNPVDNHSHYSGLWNAPAPSDYVVSQGLGWTSEAFEVVFQDEEGQPGWIIAEGDDPVPGHTDLCFYYVSEGVAPGTTGDIVFYENGCDADQPAGPDNRNGFRRFTDFEEQEVWVDFTLPGGTAPDSFVAGYPMYPHTLQKAANFHRIRFNPGSGSSCELDAQTPVCQLDLTWSTDGNYPDTTVFVLESQSGNRDMVWSATTMDEFSWTTSQAGSYVFELRMGNAPESSLMALSESFEVIGIAPAGADPEVPPPPVAAPNLTPTIASSSTGSTTGEPFVTPTGGAGFRIPILTAPGSGGFSPSVSLVYDSHAGNGPLGVGWSIDGFSVISRCAPTFEQDGIEASARVSFSAQDRFCLDGERLLAVDGPYGGHGTEYRKERDDYTRVISYGAGSNGPDYFRAWSREGIVHEFGRSADSRIETRVAGISSVAFAWAQNRAEDTAGNYINYLYSENQQGPVDFVLSRIEYTGNSAAGTQPYAELRFEYSPSRSDAQTAYMAGVAYSHTRLLQRMDSMSRVNAGSPLEFLRSYQLDYDSDGWGRAALDSITECRDTSLAVCFEPTGFTWQKSEHGVSDAGPDVSAVFTADFRGLAIGDVNGDGRPDLLITEREGSGFEFRIAIAEASGSFTPQVQRYPLPHGDDPGVPVALTVIDLNADGYQDVLYIGETSGEEQWYARLAGPVGFGDEFVVLGDCCGLKSPDLLQVMDFNGDGLSDIMTHRPVIEFQDASEIVILINDFEPGGAPGFQTPLVVDVNFPDLFPVSTPTGWEVADEAPIFGFQTTHYLPGRVDEFYGDGSVDILVKLSREYRRCLGPCTPLNTGATEPPEPPVFRIAGASGASRAVDPIGDPYEEWGRVTFYLVFYSDESGEFSTYELLAKGEGDDCDVSDICSPYSTLPEVRRTQAADINADGLADVVFLDEAYEWHSRLNTGAEFLAPELIDSPLADERLEMARFQDVTGDGFPEMFYPNVLSSEHALWMVHYNDLGHGFSAPHTSTMPFGNNDWGDSSIFLDFTADGMVDQLFLDWRHDGNGAQSGTTRTRRGVNLLTGNTHEAINAIRQIEDSFGAVSAFEYSPLTDTLVYSRMNDSAAAQWGQGSVVYDLTVPFYVVSSTEASAPTFFDSGATSINEFHYVGAKLQAGGRGLLGFAEIVTWDPQKQLRNHSLYRQDFPFTGLEAESRLYLTNEQHRSDIITDISQVVPITWPSVGPLTAISDTDAHGVLMRFSIREYIAAQAPANPRVWTLANPAWLEREFTLEGDFRSKTFSARLFDAYGNIVSDEEHRYALDNASPWSSISTSNTWLNDTAQWRLGRLATTQAEHWRANTGSSIVRTSAYAYDAQTGLLIRETTEPGSSSHQIVTEYELDDFGNRVETTVTGSGMAARGESRQFDGLGRFATQSTNAYNQVTVSILEWDVFGNPLESANIDGVVTLGGVDHMGRPFASYTENGSWSFTELTQGGHAQCPTETAYHAATVAGGGTETIACHDRLGRGIRSAVRGFLGGWIYTDNYFDLSGQPERISEPYFAGDSPYWNTTQYDALGRISSTTAANGLAEEILYDGQATHCAQSGARTMITRTNPQDGALRVQWEYRNVAGEVERILDADCGEITHAYDSVGNLVETAGIDGAVISIAYDELGLQKVQLSDPDKGLWQYASNALGEVTRQLDSKNQAIDFQYDLLGRVIHRRELRHVQSLVDNQYETVNHEVRYWQNSSVSGITGRGQVYSELYREGENGAVLHQRDYDFDEFGRVEQIDHQLESQVFVEQATYDQFGRPFQQFDASGDSRGLRYHYNAQGYVEKLQEAREGTQGVFYQQILALDQRGRPTAVTLGNQVEAFAEYDDASGFVRTLEAYDANGQEMQFVEYEFDRLGNLMGRHDRSGSADKLEEFEYDMLNRLERVLLTAPQLGLNQHVSQSISYSASGNINWKLGVGAYSYGQGVAGPHGVTQAGSVAYTYDANGNQVSASDGRQITYSVFDKAERISKGTEYSEFSYGLGNRRYKRVDNNAVDQLKVTLTIGDVEQIQEGNSDPFLKRYIQGVAIVDFYPVGQQSESWYLTRDHLGSVHSISNEVGLKVQESHFGPWGTRQDSDWQSPLAGSALVAANAFTTKGFTGHEHADALGVIHMNGRIYDPRLGRFLQADPVIQAPRNGQSLNRYSYVLNNPLSYTDPSGFFFKRLIRKWGRVIVAAIAAYYTFGLAYGWSASAVAAGANASFGFAQFVSTVGWQTLAGVSAGAISGFVAGAIMTGNLRGSVRSAFAGAITAGINKYFGNRYNLRRVAAESIGGAVSARILGGKFDDGLRFALLVSSLNYANYRMRQVAGAVADRNPANTGKPSGGFYGDQTARAGSLRTRNPSFPEKSDIEFLKCDSQAGGCQGGDVLNEADVVNSHLGPIPYSPYGTLDYIVESFAGPHDWFRLKTGSYNLQTGFNYYREGIEKIWDGVKNYTLIPVAAPFAGAGILTTSPNLYLIAQYQLLGD